MTESPDEIDFDGLDYKSENVDRVWAAVKDILLEQGRVYNYELSEQLDFDALPYGKGTIVKDILPRLRRVLESEDIISVETSIGEDGKAFKHEWIFDGDD